MTIKFRPAYTGRRDDILRLIPPDAKKVLDIGCSIGTLGAAIKAQTGAQVVGIELSQEMADVAATQIDMVFVGDVEEIIFRQAFQDLTFDTIILADLLEHLRDPWSVLAAAVKHLDRKGIVIASIPNVRHISTILSLVLIGYWPYRDRGIHDRTHLRFFSKRNIIELFEKSCLSIEKMQANYRFVDRACRINHLARFFALPVLRDFLAFQYLIRARVMCNAHDYGKSP